LTGGYQEYMIVPWKAGGDSGGFGRSRSWSAALRRGDDLQSLRNSGARPVTCGGSGIAGSDIWAYSSLRNSGIGGGCRRGPENAELAKKLGRAHLFDSKNGDTVAELQRLGERK